MCSKSISVYSIKYGESVLPESMVFFDGSSDKSIPISFTIYLILSNGRRILVDAGCDTMPGFVMKDFYSPAAALQEVGFTSDDITDVIITHAHHDHIEAIGHFKNAAVYMSVEEYTTGKNYIPSDMQVNLFLDEFIITPQIKVKKWGGHSVGSAIVEIETENTIHVLAGDECYINECISFKRPTGAYFNLEKSREFTEKYSGKNYCVHTCHDISLKTERII